MLVLYNVCETAAGADYSGRAGVNRHGKNGDATAVNSDFAQCVVEVIRNLAELTFYESGHGMRLLPLLE
jgi:hypothetical protein